MSQETRPTTELEKEVLTYLNRLRESGVTNMFGAYPYIAEGFDLGKNESRELLKLWMDNFNQECNYESVKIKN